MRKGAESITVKNIQNRVRFLRKINSLSIWSGTLLTCGSQSRFTTENIDFIAYKDGNFLFWIKT